MRLAVDASSPNALWSATLRLRGGEWKKGPQRQSAMLALVSIWQWTRGPLGGEQRGGGGYRSRERGCENVQVVVFWRSGEWAHFCGGTMSLLMLGTPVERARRAREGERAEDTISAQNTLSSRITQLRCLA